MQMMKLCQLLFCSAMLQRVQCARIWEGSELDKVKGRIAFLQRDSGFSVSHEHAERLCTSTVINGASDALGTSDGVASTSQLAEVLDASDADVDALFRALSGDEYNGGQHFALEAFCEEVVIRIPKLLGVAAPPSPGLGCVDSSCAEAHVDLSEVSLTHSNLTTAPSPTGSDVDTSINVSRPAQPASPEDLGRDLFRRVLNVLFGIYPAVNEIDDESPVSLLQEEDTLRDPKAQVVFGPKTRPDRHQRYNAYVLQASAWIATALRRLKSGRRYVKK
eukprot:TRINITY_DN13085_c0_g2_i1.p1 TRINITY_DN13085_c0_g2~~TRINITY_DN13085_c0_g2_i1.p1  ORF type:complete len:276 (+),score=41.11 TRINITY_DN13085_c0_g2_i1:61-888(+)